MSLTEKFLFLICNKLFGLSFEQFLTYSIFLEIGITVLVAIIFIVICLSFKKRGK